LNMLFFHPNHQKKYVKQNFYLKINMKFIRKQQKRLNEFQWFNDTIKYNILFSY
jgi:uncharacterized membrane protein (UPF0127 family)